MRFDYHFILAWYLSILFVVRKRVLWFFILVHFHMKASWWVACGKNSRLKHFTLVKINIAFLVTLAMHLLTAFEAWSNFILLMEAKWKNDKPCHRGSSTFIKNIYNRYRKMGFIQHIVTKIQNYEKIKVRYGTFNYEVSMKYPINYHLFNAMRLFRRIHRLP